MYADLPACTCVYMKELNQLDSITEGSSSWTSLAKKSSTAEGGSQQLKLLEKSIS